MKNENLIYKRQMAILILVLGFTFKVSRLPQLIVQEMQSSGLLLMAIYLFFEVLSFFVIYKFVLIEGSKTIEENGNKILYKILMLVMMMYFLFKLVLMYSGTVVFVTELLFENITTVEIAFSLILPILFLAYKGIRTISRTSEILIWVSVAIVAVNLLFLNTTMNYMRNLPLLNEPFLEFLSKGNKFHFWFGDFTPFIFISVKSTKKNYIKLMLSLTILLTLYIFVVMYAIYGNSATNITNFIVKLASYNQFEDKLGRLDWTGMIAWQMQGIVYLSIYLWATIEAGVRIINKRNYITLFVVLVVIISEILIKDVNKIIEIAVSNVKYLAVIANYFIPVILLFMALQIRKNKSKTESNVLQKNLIQPDTGGGNK